MKPKFHFDLSRFSSLEIASGVLAVALLICLFSMPYGYYTLVRVATMVILLCCEKWAIAG